MNFFGLNLLAYCGSVDLAILYAATAAFLGDFVILLILDCIQGELLERKYFIRKYKLFYRAILALLILQILPG